MIIDAAKTYDDLADHYHLIFDDWERSMERQAALVGLDAVRNLRLGSRGGLLV